LRKLLFSHAGDMWRCLDESGADWIEKKPLPAHAGKRQFMAPGGRLMAENDKSWGVSTDF
jgi:hypothetical protein